MDAPQGPSTLVLQQSTSSVGTGCEGACSRAPAVTLGNLGALRHWNWGRSPCTLWASWMEPGTEELMTMDATRRAPGRHLLWRPLFHSQNTLPGTCLMTLLCRPTRFINSGLRSMAACAGARRDPGDLQWPPAVLHPVSGRHGVPQQLPSLILSRNSILSPPPLPSFPHPLSQRRALANPTPFCPPSTCTKRVSGS